MKEARLFLRSTEVLCRATVSMPLSSTRWSPLIHNYQPGLSQELGIFDGDSHLLMCTEFASHVLLHVAC